MTINSLLGLHLAQDVPLDKILALELLDLMRVPDHLVDLSRPLSLLLPLLVLFNPFPQLLLMLDLGLEQQGRQLL
jgi:hypothetical protein